MTYESTFEILRNEYGALMTPNEAAKVLRQHPAHIRRLCELNKLPAVKIGARWHINTAKLAAMLEGESV